MKGAIRRWEDGVNQVVSVISELELGIYLEFRIRNFGFGFWKRQRIVFQTTRYFLTTPSFSQISSMIPWY